MKKREQRRYLAEKHRDRQIRLRKQYWFGWGGNPTDFDRKFLREKAKRFAFICYLKGNYYELSDPIGISEYWEPDEKTRGRYKKISWKNYGKRCDCCANPRRRPFKRKEKLTLQELRSDEAFKEDLYEFWR